MSGIPTYDAIKIPSHVETILITGAGGFVGQKLTQLLLQYAPNVKLLLTDVIQPPTFGISDESKLKSVKADLGDTSAVKAVFEGEKIGLVYALHGIMSGGSEANFDLGYAVNVDSHLNLLRAAYAHAQATGQTGDKKPVYVFVSSLAIYGGPGCGPLDHVDPRKTPLYPGTSYGIEKNIMELYVYDYGRKGYLDTRSVRLPTVCIRSGAPSTAASSFVSGLIREPLQGIRTTLPIASSPDDPNVNNYPLYCTKVTTVLRNIAYAGVMPEDRFPAGEGRSINLPGVRVTPKQMLAALKKYGGEEAFKLVDYKIDTAVQTICKTWAGDYDSSIAQKMGFQVDDKEEGYNEAVEEFIEHELKGGGK